MLRTAFRSPMWIHNDRATEWFTSLWRNTEELILWFFFLLHNWQAPASTPVYSSFSTSAPVLFSGAQFPQMTSSETVLKLPSFQSLLKSPQSSSISIHRPITLCSPNNSPAAVDTPPMARWIFKARPDDLRGKTHVRSLTCFLIMWISISKVTSVLKCFHCCIWHL